MKNFLKTFLIGGFFLTCLLSCNDNSTSGSDSQTYQHFCGHCSQGFDGGGFTRDSDGTAISISNSEVESYPRHYCTESCALMD